MSLDSASSEAAPASPDYVPGPEEPEQAPLSPDYVPGPKYPEYLAPSDEEVPMEDQPYAIADSPIALSPGYVADFEDGLVDYPADRGDDDNDDSSDDDDEEEEAEEEEEHLALADSVVAPVVDHVPSSEETGPFKTDESAATPPSPPACQEEVGRLLALPPPPPSPLISLSPPSAEECLARCLAAPALPSSPLPIVPHPYGIPNHVRAPLGFRTVMGRLRAPSPSTTSITTITTSTIITTFTTTCTYLITITIITTTTTTNLTVYTTISRPSTAAPRPAGDHGIDYGFIGTLDAETRRQRAEEVGYGIRDTWVDPREAAEEIAPVTLEGVNTTVTELAAVQEQDTQDIYDVIEDAQDRQTQIFQSVETLIDDRQYHYK
ncbi:hypothetical protein Tco_1557198, partial [Tanacetum coccineum]